MADRDTPGVYVEENSGLPPSVVPVDTAVPAFVGYTAMAMDAVPDDLRMKPKRIGSMAEYERYFGGPQPETAVTVTLHATTTPRAGRRVGVRSSVELPEARRSRHVLHYALQLFFANGGTSAYVVSVDAYREIATALDAGRLKEGVDVLAAADEPTLICVPEAQSLPFEAYARVNAAALDQCAALRDRFVILDLHGGDAEPLNDPGSDLAAAVAHFRAGSLGHNLQYGAVYAPNLRTVLHPAVDEDRVQVTHVLNGAHGVTAPLSGLADHLKEQARAALGTLRLTLPPSGAIAGVYAKTDAARGVWKAPANVALAAVEGPTIECTDAVNAGMNTDPTGKSVNAIRSFAGRGTLVWGARTLAGNDNEWRYVGVRRYFLFVEQSVKQALQRVTFEPNDATTWGTVHAMIENFLITQWRDGALPGTKPEHAFYVAVGLGRTMTTADILADRMIVEIGLAPVRPAEFTILRLSHPMAQN